MRKGIPETTSEVRFLEQRKTWVKDQGFPAHRMRVEHPAKDVSRWMGKRPFFSKWRLTLIKPSAQVERGRAVCLDLTNLPDNPVFTQKGGRKRAGEADLL